MTAESGLFVVLRGAPSREIQKILAIFPASREFGLAPRPGGNRGKVPEAWPSSDPVGAAIK